MGNFTLSEILTIVLVILIVFGPKRLPDLARRAGQWVTKARQAALAMRAEFMTEYKDAVQPLVDVRDELKSTQDVLRDDFKAISDDVTSTKAELQGDFKAISDEIKSTASEPKDESDDVSSEDVSSEETA